MSKDSQSCQLGSLVEELEMLIDENLQTSTTQVSASCQTAAQLDQQEEDWKLKLERKNSEVDRLLIKSKEAEVDLLRKEMIIEGISEKLAVLQSRLCQVEDCRRNAEDSLNSMMANYEHKLEKKDAERLENKTKANSEMPATAFSTPLQSPLYRKLEQFEDQLKEIIANNKIAKEKTAIKTKNYRPIVTNHIKMAGTKDLGKTPLARR